MLEQVDGIACAMFAASQIITGPCRLNGTGNGFQRDMGDLWSVGERDLTRVWSGGLI
jgi:hypothetical protein